MADNKDVLISDFLHPKMNVNETLKTNDDDDDDDNKTVATSNSNHHRIQHQQDKTDSDCMISPLEVIEQQETNETKLHSKNDVDTSMPSLQQHQEDKGLNTITIPNDVDKTSQQQRSQQSRWEQSQRTFIESYSDNNIESVTRFMNINNEEQIIVDDTILRNNKTIASTDYYNNTTNIMSSLTSFYSVLSTFMQTDIPLPDMHLRDSSNENNWRFQPVSSNASSTSTSRSTSPHSSESNGMFDRHASREHAISSLSSMYRNFIYKHNDTIFKLDDTINRILFWIPYTSTTRIVWGLLELNRLCMNITLRQHDEHSDVPSSNPYGMSVVSNSVEPHGTTIRFGLTVIQSLLPILQELASMITVKTADHENDYQYHEHNQSIVRCYVERIRFILRLTLLTSYWYDIHKQERNQRQLSEDGIKNYSNSTTLPIVPGIMLNGGQYYYDEPMSSTPTPPTVRQEQKRMERLQYVGKRTGRRIIATTSTTGSVMKTEKMSHTDNRSKQMENHEESSQPLILLRGISSKLHLFSSVFQSVRDRIAMMTTASSTNVIRMKQMKMMLGELLYVIRPWIQAEMHQRIYSKTASGAITSSSSNRSDTTSGNYSPRKQLLVTWLLSLGMDLTSLKLLQNERNTTSTNTNSTRNIFRRDHNYDHSNHGSSINEVEVLEMKRRKMRLMLYLLRCPIYDTYTRPSIETMTSIIETCIPYLGKMFITNSIWDLIYYWKYYRLEEG